MPQSATKSCLVSGIALCRSALGRIGRLARVVRVRRRGHRDNHVNRTNVRANPAAMASVRVDHELRAAEENAPRGAHCHAILAGGASSHDLHHLASYAHLPPPFRTLSNARSTPSGLILRSFIA